MRARYQFFLALLLILSGSVVQPLCAQLGFDLKIDKPEPYDNRVLRAEKTGNKALKPSKKFLQNLTTHYNYYFNASNKLNEVIEGAKANFSDDYTTLLPFYNYTLDETAQNATQLDSVIYKSRTGLVMHDLRNDWADNMYLLWGAAWFFQKKFDSAALMFQFINYAFAEKEKDGYYRYIGSRLDGNNALTIATDEKNKATSHYGSRNNAFIWQIRTFIESGRHTEAATMIATLKNDPFFPSRLAKDMEEVQAYLFYHQKNWDSSAVHLINALDNAGTRQERARWEYLIAQMLERTGKYEEAKTFYTKSISHTTDPVMDVYSRLNVVRVTKDSSENHIDRNVEELLKMAKRDKYTDYRDVIYYMAAQMEMERNNLAAAQDLMIKASKYNNGNLRSRSRSFLMIADLAYEQKKYLQAASFYDSLSLADFKDQELKRIEERKAALSKLVANTSVLYRQDSLQKIAAMPEEERTAYINKLLRRILKEQGLSESTLTSGNLMPAKGSTDLFSASQTKGEWYFYNSTLRTQGAAQFRQVWGNRPNADNWRRFSAVSQQGVVKTQVNPNLPNTPGAGNNQATGVDEAPSFSGLLGKLPLTEDQLKVSNDSISNALFHVGTVLLNEMEDYLSSIDAYEKLRSRYPSYPNMAEVLFNLYYAYKKAGNETEAARIRQLLLSQFPESRYASILTTGKDPVGANRSQEITRAYEDIYNLFIEGRFEEAQSSKRLADSTYKTNYWQPQLLYIEAVYHIRQREDSIAKTSLQKLIGQEPNSPMAKKAQVMIDVLNRRKEIEEELSRYQIQQPVDDTTAVTPVVPQPIAQNPPARRDTVGQRPNVLTPIKDPVIARKDPVITSPPVTKDPVVTNPPVSRDSAISNPPVTKDTATTRLPVTNIPEKKDTAAGKLIVSQPTVRQDTVSKKPVVTIPPVQKDTVFNRRPRIPGQYYFDPAQKHFTVIILDKVDPLFVTEVQNAYSRFNRERYRGQVMQMRTVELDATRRMVLIGDFANSTDAVNYMQAAKNAAPTDVMPWLKAEKYSFYIITEENLPLFLEKKDTEDYRKFLVQNLPGKF